MNIIKQEYFFGPFESRRVKPLEDGIDVRSLEYKWNFSDNNLESSIDVILTENVDLKNGTANISAIVSYDNSKIKEDNIRIYVTKQLEQIAKDGKAFPE